MTTDKPVLWLDLETSGLGNDAAILEVGMLVTDGLYGDEIAAGSWCVKPAEITLTTLVFDMHWQNGLLADIYHYGQDERAVRDEIGVWLDQRFALSDSIAVAGSGVDRFDVPLLRHQWPEIAGRFHWRTYDMSTVKRVAHDAGLDTDLLNNGTGHRALDDCRWAHNVARNVHALIASAIAAENRVEAQP